MTDRVRQAVGAIDDEDLRGHGDAHLKTLSLSRPEVAPRRATTGAQPGERPTGEQVTYLLALSPDEAGEVIYLSAYESVWMALVPEGQQPSGPLTIGVNEVLK